jgi:hypothetical protein
MYAAFTINYRFQAIEMNFNTSFRAARFPRSKLRLGFYKLLKNVAARRVRTSQLVKLVIAKIVGSETTL